MAKKEEAPNMVERFAEFKELKNIDKTTMISVLEESFRNVLSKMFGTDENLDVIMNPDKGDVQIFQNLEVVPDGEVTDPNTQISLSDARADQDPDVEIGEEHTMTSTHKDRFLLLTPRANNLARIRLGNTYSVGTVLEARPHHQQFASLCAIEITAVCYIGLVILCSTSR